jgi:hypothetical protein
VGLQLSAIGRMPGLQVAAGLIEPTVFP